jgi:hypothetical protein
MLAPKQRSAPQRIHQTGAQDKRTPLRHQSGIKDAMKRYRSRGPRKDAPAGRATSHG